MSQIEKNGNKIAAGLLIASAAPLATTLDVIAQEPEQPQKAEDPVAGELDASREYFSEEKPEPENIPDTIQAQRVLEEIRQSQRQSQNEGPHLSAREIFMRFDHSLPAQTEQPFEKQDETVQVQSVATQALMDSQTLTIDRIENSQNRTIDNVSFFREVKPAESNSAAQQIVIGSEMLDHPEQLFERESVEAMPTFMVESGDNNILQSPIQLDQDQIRNEQSGSISAPEVEEQPSDQPETPGENQNSENPGGTGLTESQQAMNQRIVDAALSLIGTTDGLQCTEVVSIALSEAGIPARNDWPDTYVSYGYLVDDPVPGNLIYYDNGGRGVDHIAIYIGDGQAVHGNFTLVEGEPSQTLIYDVMYQEGLSPVYIQVS